MSLDRIPRCAVAFSVLGAIASLAPISAPRAAAATRPSGPCGTTTLDGTIADIGRDGVLDCGPGDERILRDELLRKAGPVRLPAQPLGAFVLLSDLHQGDEELTLPSRTNWRGWAVLAPYLLNAQVKAINTLAAKRSPVSKQKIGAVFSLGDDADNAQYNEMLLTTQTLAGRRLVDTNSGEPGHDNPNEIEPHGVRWLRSPVAGQRISDLANQPFYAEGLHYPDGRAIPWFAVHGNHNTKVMGGIPHEDAAWRNAARKWAVGDLRVAGLNARLAGELDAIRANAPQKETKFWMRVFKLARTSPAAVGDVRNVKADLRRRMLSREQWMSALIDGPGSPDGHGFLPTAARCPDVYGDGFARRACYVVDKGAVRFIALDDSSLEGYTGGSVDRAQLKWLEQQLVASSRISYDRVGRRVINPDAENRYIVVMSHHTSEGMHNTAAKPDVFGDDLQELLLRFPNVVLHASGHSHSNRVWTRKNKQLGTGYWEVATPSLIDAPHSGRTVELVRNADGTVTISSTLFEPRVDPNPSHIDWKRDDPTDETKFGAKRHINEDWLASLALEAAEVSRDEKRFGKADDRNVELVIADPLALTGAIAKASTVPGLLPASIAGLAAVVIGLLLRRRRGPGAEPSSPLIPPQRPTTPAKQRVSSGSSRQQRRAA
jgi:hypothetical protein